MDGEFCKENLDICRYLCVVYRTNDCMGFNKLRNKIFEIFLFLKLKIGPAWLTIPHLDTKLRPGRISTSAKLQIVCLLR